MRAHGSRQGAVWVAGLASAVSTVMLLEAWWAHSSPTGTPGCCEEVHVESETQKLLERFYMAWHPVCDQGTCPSGISMGSYRTLESSQSLSLSLSFHRDAAEPVMRACFLGSKEPGMWGSLSMTTGGAGVRGLQLPLWQSPASNYNLFDMKSQLYDSSCISFSCIRNHPQTFIFLAELYGMWDPSSPTRYWTFPPALHWKLRILTMDCREVPISKLSGLKWQFINCQDSKLAGLLWHPFWSGPESTLPSRVARGSGVFAELGGMVEIVLHRGLPIPSRLPWACCDDGGWSQQ